jgi:hypothetical protein
VQVVTPIKNPDSDLSPIEVESGFFKSVNLVEFDNLTDLPATCCELASPFGGREGVFLSRKWE